MKINSDSDNKLNAIAKFPMHKMKNKEKKKAFFLSNLSEIILKINKIVKNQQQKLTKIPHFTTNASECRNNKGKPTIAEISNGLPSFNFVSK
jgi:hypothetical protein